METTSVTYFDKFLAKLVFVDGIFAPHLSKLDGLSEKVIFINMREAKSKYVNLLKQYPQNSSQDGVFLYLPNNKILEQPLYILFLSSAPKRETNLNNLFVATPGSSCKILVECATSGKPDDVAKNIFGTMIIGEGAKVDYYFVQNANIAAKHNSYFESRQHSTSCLTATYLDFGGGAVSESWQVFLEGKKANVKLHGLSLLRKTQEHDFSLVVKHLVPETESHILFKSILDDAAHLKFLGKINIAQDAQKSAAKLINHNLLLGNSACIDTLPELEIYADDVKCSHGATSGQIDEQALFYLRARGIAKSGAEKLLVQAFMGEVISKISDSDLQNYFRHLISITIR